MTTDGSDLSWAKLATILVIITITGVFVSLAHVVTVNLRYKVLDEIVEVRAEVAELKAETTLEIKPKDVLAELEKLRQEFAELRKEIAP